MVTDNSDQIESLEARAAEIVTQISIAEADGDDELVASLEEEGEDLADEVEELEAEDEEDEEEEAEEDQLEISIFNSAADEMEEHTEEEANTLESIERTGDEGLDLTLTYEEGEEDEEGEGEGEEEAAAIAEAAEEEAAAEEEEDVPEITPEEIEAMMAANEAANAEAEAEEAMMMAEEEEEEEELELEEMEMEEEEEEEEGEEEEAPPPDPMDPSQYDQDELWEQVEEEAKSRYPDLKTMLSDHHETVKQKMNAIRQKHK